MFGHGETKATCLWLKCLRRTAPRPDPCLMIDPPLIIVFECEYLIEAKK